MPRVGPMTDELFTILRITPQNTPVFQTREIVVVGIRAHGLEPNGWQAGRSPYKPILRPPATANSYDLLAGAATGSMLTRRPCLSKRTWPSVRAKRVQSRPMPTLAPA